MEECPLGVGKRKAVVAGGPKVVAFGCEQKTEAVGIDDFRFLPVVGEDECWRCHAVAAIGGKKACTGFPDTYAVLLGFRPLVAGRCVATVLVRAESYGCRARTFAAC